MNGAKLSWGGIMKIAVFNKEVELDEDIVNTYEETHGFIFLPVEAESFAISQGANKDSPVKELTKAIEEALLDMIAMRPQLLHDYSKAMKEGLFNDPSNLS